MRITYNSPVVLSYTLLCAGVLFIENLLNTRVATQYFFTVYPMFDFGDVTAYFRLFGHVVGHADWTHLLGNFTFILLLGPILEEKYGSRNLLLMIFITALITGILNSLFFSTALLGASGVVFMLIILSSVTNFKKGHLPLTFVLVSVLFLGKEILSALNEDHISQFAHILGGVCGGFFGLYFEKGKGEKVNKIN